MVIQFSPDSSNTSQSAEDSKGFGEFDGQVDPDYDYMSEDSATQFGEMHVDHVNSDSPSVISSQGEESTLIIRT